MKMLFDSDFLFGLFVAHDPHHSVATKQFRELQKKKVQLFVLTLVIQETATVISHKVDQKASLDFLRRMRIIADINRILIDEELENAAWKIFETQTKKGTSFVDCANLAVIEKFRLDGILSFDKFYPKKLLIG
jgi:predicted nucleic acid-binding protein